MNKLDKTKYSLIPENTVKELAEVLNFGARKHGENSWISLEPNVYYNALFRHLHERGFDLESKHLHLAHIVANSTFLLAFEKKKRRDFLIGKLNLCVALVNRWNQDRFEFNPDINIDELYAGYIAEEEEEYKTDSLVERLDAIGDILVFKIGRAYWTDLRYDFEKFELDIAPFSDDFKWPELYAQSIIIEVLQAVIESNSTKIVEKLKLGQKYGKKKKGKYFTPPTVALRYIINKWGLE